MQLIEDLVPLPAASLEYVEPGQPRVRYYTEDKLRAYAMAWAAEAIKPMQEDAERWRLFAILTEITQNRA